MGADIHIYVEKRLKSGDWAMVRDLNGGVNPDGLEPYGREVKPGAAAHSGGYWKLSYRNYTLFGKLAGVRVQGPKPKGLPKDLSRYVREERDSWQNDAHSDSWSTPLEFMEAYVAAGRGDAKTLDKYVQIRITEGADVAVRRFLQDMCSINVDSGEEYRFVYWFDN